MRSLIFALILLVAMYSPIMAMHTSPPTHPCHLYAGDRWSDTLTVEYAQMYVEGGTFFMTTSNGCLCLVYADRSLLQVQTIVLAGRTFVGAGGIKNGIIVLEKVCDTLEECK